MKKAILALVVIVLVGLIAKGLIWWRALGGNAGAVWDGIDGTETITRTEYHAPPAEPKAVVVDDRLEDKAPAFDPDLADRRPEKGWLVNTSAAVIRLDAPIVRPDAEPELLALHPSYAAAIASKREWDTILPSVNMIDGKAKQFDDGLVAALEQALLQGKGPKLPRHVSVVKRLFERVGPESPAAPFLAAGLSLIGEKAKAADKSEQQAWLHAFEANQVLSKPIGVYTWNKTLFDGFRFLRFFQQPFHVKAVPAIPRALAAALKQDGALLDDYKRAVAFDTGLNSRPAFAPVSDYLEKAEPDLVSLFPPCGSREEELFSRLFPEGLPPDADLMRALIERIRSGQVDLTPKPGEGWYDHQVYALETLLLSERGDESRKLLLTRSYKLRMLEAFKALMTKRRETHAAGVKTAESPAPLPLETIAPRLRVEPCPTFFLRTARAYAFLDAFLESSVGGEVLKSLRGLREKGERSLDLKTELAWMRDLFYGLYFLSAEDIGMRAKLNEDEPVDRGGCERTATEWLARAGTDPDLAADTRVSVPIFVDPGRAVTRLWATLGVRLTRLTASYARPPRLKSREGDGEWKDAAPHQLRTAHFLIPVDEFAEVELRGNRSLNRDELRRACDREKTKEKIVSALQE